MYWIWLKHNIQNLIAHIYTHHIYPSESPRQTISNHRLTSKVISDPTGTSPICPCAEVVWCAKASIFSDLRHLKTVFDVFGDFWIYLVKMLANLVKTRATLTWHDMAADLWQHCKFYLSEWCLMVSLNKMLLTYWSQKKCRQKCSPRQLWGNRTLWMKTSRPNLSAAAGQSMKPRHWGGCGFSTSEKIQPLHWKQLTTKSTFKFHNIFSLQDNIYGIPPCLCQNKPKKHRETEAVLGVESLDPALTSGWLFFFFFSANLCGLWLWLVTKNWCTFVGSNAEPTFSHNNSVTVHLI